MPTRKKYPRFSRRHADVMKWLFDHPAATLRDCAAAVGYSRSWLSRVVNAPEFRRLHREYLMEETRRAVRRMLTIQKS